MEDNLKSVSSREEKKSKRNYGKIILDEMRNATNFSKWGVDISFRELFGRVIEIGCGLGNNLDHLHKHFTDLWVCDYRQEYLDHVTSTKPYMTNKTLMWDITLPNNFDITFDSFFCSNVLEHIYDDQNAMKNISNIPGIKSGVVIVPANKIIYNKLDANVDHHRRYSKGELVQKLTDSGFKVMGIYSLNKIGVLGWIVQGGIFKLDTLGSRNVKLFNKLTPFIKMIDPILPWTGLSLVAILKKDQ